MEERDEKQRQVRREEGGEDEKECVYMCTHVNARERQRGRHRDTERQRI